MFERIGKCVTLTDAGEVLLEYARLVLRSLHDADQALTALKGVSGGRVRLGLVSTAKYIVPHMITRFRAAYPGVAVLLREGNRDHVQHLLTSGAIDLAIMGQPAEDADVAAERFAPHPSVIVAHPGHRLCRAPHLQPVDLAAEWFIESGSHGLTWRHDHEKAAVALRGPLTDVLTVIYRRRSVDHSQVDVLGSRELLDLWLDRLDLG